MLAAFEAVAAVGTMRAMAPLASNLLPGPDEEEPGLAAAYVLNEADRQEFRSDVALGSHSKAVEDAPAPAHAWRWPRAA